MNQFEKTWEELKRDEKGETSITSGLKRIPSHLPALIKAEKIQHKAALVGFDWDDINDVFEKIKEECFPIVIGGDSSVSIASALASAKANVDVGLIWIDAHSDYHTFESTTTGNICGLSLAAINGYKCSELRTYFDGKIIQPSKTVIIGGGDLDDKESSKVALLENLQRKNLNPIEEARTYQKILEIDEMTQEELAKTMGKSQSAVANKIRLLSLPEEIQENFELPSVDFLNNLINTDKPPT